MTTLECHMDWEEIFTRYEEMIHAVAHRIATQFGGEHEDLINEGWAKVMPRLGAWKPEKGSFSTWFYRAMYYAMRDFAVECPWKSEKEISLSGQVDESGEDVLQPASRSSWVDEMGREMGEEARELFHAVVKAPKHLMRNIFHQNQIEKRKQLRKYAMKALKFPKAVAKEALEELEAVFGG